MPNHVSVDALKKQTKKKKEKTQQPCNLLAKELFFFSAELSVD